MDQLDIHERHQVPASPNVFNHIRSNAMADKPTKNEFDGDASNQSSSNVRSKTTQAVRNAHFQEDGVKRNGKVPGSVGSEEAAEANKATE